MVFCVPFRHERERERENAKNIKWNYYFPIFRNKRECYRTIYGSCCGVDLRLVQLGVEIKLLKLMMHMSNAFVIFPFRAKLKMNPKTSFYSHTMIGGQNWRWWNIKEMIYCGLALKNTKSSRESFHFQFFILSKTSHSQSDGWFQPQKENSCIITSFFITTWIRREQKRRKKINHWLKIIFRKCIIIIERDGGQSWVYRLLLCC